MKEDDIIRAVKLADEIRNFNDCYVECRLSGNVDGMVTPEALLSFLTENPHMQEIAGRVNKLKAL